MLEVTDSSLIPKVNAGIIIDALLGTGTKGKLKPPISKVVDYINSLSGFKIAVDVPTGIDSDTGEVLGAAIKADLTITFHKAKPGLDKAKKYVGELAVVDIGLPIRNRTVCRSRRRVTCHQIAQPYSLTREILDDYSLLAAAKFTLALQHLVSLAALRTGVDIVYLAAPEKTAYAISSMSPDLITVKLEGDKQPLPQQTWKQLNLT